MAGYRRGELEDLMSAIVPFAEVSRATKGSSEWTTPIGKLWSAWTPASLRSMAGQCTSPTKSTAFFSCSACAKARQ